MLVLNYIFEIKSGFFLCKIYIAQYISVWKWLEQKQSYKTNNESACLTW